ncbi:hypothetical protein U1Q18_023142 [Sarracenia purpurea var. burkii]
MPQSVATAKMVLFTALIAAKYLVRVIIGPAAKIYAILSVCDGFDACVVWYFGPGAGMVVWFGLAFEHVWSCCRMIMACLPCCYLGQLRLSSDSEAVWWSAVFDLLVGQRCLSFDNEAVLLVPSIWGCLTSGYWSFGLDGLFLSDFAMALVCLPSVVLGVCGLLCLVVFVGLVYCCVWLWMCCAIGYFCCDFEFCGGSDVLSGCFDDLR